MHFRVRATPKLPLSPKCITDQLLHNFIITTSILKILEVLEPVIYDLYLFFSLFFYQIVVETRWEKIAYPREAYPGEHVKLKFSV